LKCLIEPYCFFTILKVIRFYQTLPLYIIDNNFKKLKNVPKIN